MLVRRSGLTLQALRLAIQGRNALFSLGDTIANRRGCRHGLQNRVTPRLLLALDFQQCFGSRSRLLLSLLELSLRRCDIGVGRFENPAVALQFLLMTCQLLVGAD